jgi:uncharacterized protein YndB with AHSA1/START domain
MNDDLKPAASLELGVAIDATAEAVWKAVTEAAQVGNWFAPEVSGAGSGKGSTLRVSWGGGMEFTTTIGAWEPKRHVQWLHDEMFGPGTKLVADWYIATESGATTLRLVQSGFGGFDGWGDFISSTEVGWRYFLHNIKVYLERHAAKKRRMISRRFPVGIGRSQAWKKLPAARQGDKVTLDLGEKLEAVVDLSIPERGLALRIPSLDHALLFYEFEGTGEEFHAGAWLSVYDPNAATRIEAGAAQAFDRLSAAVK